MKKLSLDQKLNQISSYRLGFFRRFLATQILFFQFPCQTKIEFIKFKVSTCSLSHPCSDVTMHRNSSWGMRNQGISWQGIPHKENRQGKQGIE